VRGGEGAAAHHPITCSFTGTRVCFCDTSNFSSWGGATRSKLMFTVTFMPDSSTFLPLFKKPSDLRAQSQRLEHKRRNVDTEYKSIWKNKSSVNPKLIERNPPRGGFLFTMFPDQEPCVRGPPSKNLVQILRGGPLTHGS